MKNFLTVKIPCGLPRGGFNTLRVKCVRCHKEWKKDCVVPWGPDDCSGSLCTACFIDVASPTIRKKQLKEGHFDCFGRARGYCDQSECKYRRWCLGIDGEKAETN